MVAIIALNRLKHNVVLNITNSQIIEAAVLDESETAAFLDFGRDNAGYAVNLSGQIWTISVNQYKHNQNHHLVKSSHFGNVDTAELLKHDFYLYQSQWVSAKEKEQWFTSFLPGIGKTISIQVADAEGRWFVPIQTLQSVELFLNKISQS